MSIFEVIASWVQAIGSVGALVAAVILWRKDRTRKQKENFREEKEHLRRLIAALRSEIFEAIESAGMRQHAIDELFARLEQLKQLEKDGRPIQIRDTPLGSDSINITDGIIYRAVASELGRLPAGFVSDIVRFYALTQEFTRLAKIGTSAMDTYRSVRPLLPRIRMRGGMLVKLLEKFVESDFDASANLKLTREEISELARRFDYPLDQIVKERSLGLGVQG